jgi:hypothetical protein
MAIFNVISSHRYSARSGDLTVIAANGVIASWRWGNANYKARVTSIKYGAVITTGFTAAQLVAMDVGIVRGFNASNTGGTALTRTSPATKLRSAATTEDTRLTDARISATAALGGGAGTVDPIGIDSVWALAATAGARIHEELDFTRTELGGVIFEQDQGVILRNLVLLGAAGTAQAYFTIAWDEGTVG